MIPSDLDILIIESDPAISGALSAALQKRGHFVRVAESCEEALNLPRPDALVTGAEPGGLTATELMRHYLSSGPLPRTVVIAEQPSLDECRETLRLGAADYLATPYRLEELIRAVESESAATVAATGTATQLAITLKAEESEVARAGRAIAAFCTRAGMGPSTRARITSATLEAVENAVRHAYPSCKGTVEIELSLDARDCHVRVIDQGIGFDAKDSYREHGDGLLPGLARAGACAEEIKVLSAIGSGTTAELRFRAYRVDFDEAGSIDLSEYDYFTPSTAREVLRTLAVDERGDLFTLSPALALLVGRLLAGPTMSDTFAQAVRS